MTRPASAPHGTNGSRPSAAGGDAPAAPSPPRFRPNARRRNRIAAGIALVAAAIGLNVVLYTSLDGRAPVVQVTRDVPAGELITADMLRTVEADLDGSVDVVAGGDLDQVIGRYAKVRLVSGALVTARSLQSDPLLDEGTSVLAISVPDGALPVGLRERSPVQLVLPGDDAEVVRTIEGRVVGLPSTPESAIGTQSLSVEVAALEAPTIAAADDVRVVLIEPRPDPAATSGSDPTSEATEATGDASTGADPAGGSS
jgi:hypothetical protein